MPKYHKSQWDREACYGKETTEESQTVQEYDISFLNCFKAFVCTRQPDAVNRMMQHGLWPWKVK